MSFKTVIASLGLLAVGIVSGCQSSGNCCQSCRPACACGSSATMQNWAPSPAMPRGTDEAPSPSESYDPPPTPDSIQLPAPAPRDAEREANLDDAPRLLVIPH